MARARYFVAYPMSIGKPRRRLMNCKRAWMQLGRAWMTLANGSLLNGFPRNRNRKALGMTNRGHPFSY